VAEFEDRSQKTEQPTPRRLEKARERGQVASSREVYSLLILLSGALMLFAAGPLAGGWLLLGFRRALEGLAGAEPLSALAEAFRFAAMLVAPVLLATAAAAIAAAVLQNAVVWSGESLKPKLSRISPLSGLKRLFSRRSLVEFVKNVIKLVVIAGLLVAVLVPKWGQLQAAPEFGLAGLVRTLADVGLLLLVAVTAAMLLVAGLDYAYQRAEFLEDMRMTRREVREEFKETEGDPLIRQKLRQLRRERAKRRMMAEVPKSTVVITNPTHLAVALRYEQGRMEAPEVVAKGQGRLALRIREIARAHGVPVVENPPLAQALYRGAEVGARIPVAHYEAVARIIAHILALRRPRTGEPAGTAQQS